MKAVLLEVPQAMLDERRKLGLDGRDWVELLRSVGGRLLPLSADAAAWCAATSSVRSSPALPGGCGSAGKTAAPRSDPTEQVAGPGS